MRHSVIAEDFEAISRFLRLQRHAMQFFSIVINFKFTLGSVIRYASPFSISITVPNFANIGQTLLRCHNFVILKCTIIVRCKLSVAL